MFFTVVNVYTSLIDKVIPNAKDYGISEMRVISNNSEYMIDVMAYVENFISYVTNTEDELSHHYNPIIDKDRFGTTTTYNPLFFPEKISIKPEDAEYDTEYEEPDLICSTNRVFDRLLEEPILDIDIVLDSREFKAEMLTRKIRTH